MAFCKQEVNTECPKKEGRKKKGKKEEKKIRTKKTEKISQRKVEKRKKTEPSVTFHIIFYTTLVSCRLFGCFLTDNMEQYRNSSALVYSGKQIIYKYLLYVKKSE